MRWRRSQFLFLFTAWLVLGYFLPASFAAGNPNIVLLTLESVRADRMGFLGSITKITPNLDRIAAQSMIFEQAFAQAPLTLVSDATILSGTYPQTHRVDGFGAALAPNIPFLPDLLRAGGYRAAAFVGSIELDPKNGSAAGFDRGFSLYDAGFPQPERGKVLVERSAAQVAARASAWLAHNTRGPFFLWVHLSAPQAESGAGYNAAAGAADAAVGKLVAALRAGKLYENALIVIASDHGESLGARGEDGHGIFLYDETIHIPLLLKPPQNLSAGKRVRARVGLVDVAPTILEIAGVAVPSQMQGRSLLRIAKAGPSSDQPVYSVSDFSQQAFGWSALKSWRAGKYLYVKAPKPELYDLAADPGAAHNLAQSSKATRETMAAQLEAFDRRFSGQVTGSQLSSTEMQKLASLGYVGLQKSATPASIAASGIDPKDGIAMANRLLSARRLLDQGKAEEAVAALQPAMAGAAKMYLAHYVMGAALGRLKQCPQAIEHLRSAIELQPDSIWAHYEMGSCLLSTGDYKTSAIHLEIVSRRMPNFAGAHSRLAQAYEHLRRADDARRERSKQ